MKLWLLLLTACPLPEFVPDDTDGDTVIDVDSGSDTDVIDDDSDGSPKLVDCDDTNPDRFPGNIETCNDGVDQDCSRADCISAPLTDFTVSHPYPNQSPVSAVPIVSEGSVDTAYSFGNSQAGTLWSVQRGTTVLTNGERDLGGTTLQMVGGRGVFGAFGTEWAMYRPNSSLLEIQFAEPQDIPFMTRARTRAVSFTPGVVILDSVVALPSENAYAALVRFVAGDAAISLLTVDNVSDETVYDPTDGTTISIPEVGYGPPTDIISLNLGLTHSTAAFAHSGDPLVDPAQVLVVNLSVPFTVAPDSTRLLGSITFDGPTVFTGVTEGPVLYAAQLDDDNLDDLVVGMPRTGCVYIFRGSSLLSDQTPADAWHSYCADPTTRLGWAITQLRDQDGDGIDELVITAPGTQSGTNAALHVLYSRRLDTPVSAEHPIDILLTSPTGFGSDEGLGTSIARMPAASELDPDFIVTTRYGADGEVLTYVVNIDL